MEDAATAEISRSQLWQWVKHGARAQPSGRAIDAAWVRQLLDEEADALRGQVGDARYAASRFEDAKALLAGTIGGGPYSDFLTTLCYASICEPQARGALAAAAAAGPRTPPPAPAAARL
jgi:malate synthase